MVSAQTKNALSQTFDIGVAKEISDNLDSDFGTGQIVGGSLNVSAGGITCGTITSSGNITTAASTVSALAVVGTAVGTFGGVAITANGILLPSFTTTNRDLISVTAGSAGLTIFNSTTSKLNFYNGSAWAAVTSV